MTQYPPVTFWTAPPTIDGMLSPEKAQLPERRFAHVCKMAPENPDYPLSYRLAYGPGFFYLYIQVDAETLICRDRGFQNGDGLVLTLAKPQPAQAPTAEFYMLGFWPQDDPRQHAGQQAVGRLLWGHNGDFPFLPLDKDTQFTAIAQEGQLGFELCLPWSVVYPYHPWLSEGLGFDLFFAKAVGETQSNIYTAHLDNLDKIVPDAVQYAVLDFAPPDVTERAQVYVTMDRNAEQGHTISVQIAVLNAAPAPISLILDIHRGKSHRIETQQAALDCPAGLSAHHMTLDTQRLTSGSYQVRWRTSASEAQGAIDVTIRPQFDGGALKRRLVRARANLADGSYHTLLFEIDELAKRVVRLAPDSTCPDLQAN